MKIVDGKSITTRKEKKELNAPEKWLFEKENKKVRLTTLMNMESEKAAQVELAEFGTEKKSIRSFDKLLNQVFILGELPLIARRASDSELVIRKVEKFDLEQYNKGDKKEMSANHIETVKAKLAELA